MRRGEGFTLLEVLVALAIFALVAASVLTAGARSVRTAALLEDKTLAMWVADNRLTEMQLERSPVPDGRDEGQVTFAGRDWAWQSEVAATSEPAMRRVTLWVAADQRGGSGGVRERALVTLNGFLGGP